MRSHKVVLCGDVFVGKSAIFMRAKNGDYKQNEHAPTISATFASIKMHVTPVNSPRGAANSSGEARSDEDMEVSDRLHEVKLQLWDTPGESNYRHITKNYYNGAVAAIVAYDVTNAKSLKEAEYWLESVRETAPSTVKIYLVGNKIDLID